MQFKAFVSQWLASISLTGIVGSWTIFEGLDQTTDAIIPFVAVFSAVEFTEITKYIWNKLKELEELDIITIFYTEKKLIFVVFISILDKKWNSTTRGFSATWITLCFSHYIKVLLSFTNLKIFQRNYWPCKQYYHHHHQF